MSCYLANIGVALSVLLNALLGGERLETMSYRAAKARLLGRRWAIVVCWCLDTVDPGHCQRSLDRWAHMLAKDASQIDTEARGLHP